MVYRTLEDAIALTVDKFRGILDKEGQPFILHLMRVSTSVDAPEARIAGILHDIIEDTDVTLENLNELGFSPSVVNAVDFLTHRSGVSYCDYVIRIRSDPLARVCKVADLRDNYRLDRVAYREDHVEEDAKRLQQYVLSYQFLQDKIDESTYRRLMRAVDP